MLKESGIDPRAIRGYDLQARGHLEVAAAVAAGSADAGITLRVAAEAFGLRFFKIREEQYDLVIPEREFDTEPVRILLDALNSAALATEIAHCAITIPRRWARRSLGSTESHRAMGKRCRAAQSTRRGACP